MHENSGEGDASSRAAARAAVEGGEGSGVAQHLSRGFAWCRRGLADISMNQTIPLTRHFQTLPLSPQCVVALREPLTLGLLSSKNDSLDPAPAASSALDLPSTCPKKGLLGTSGALGLER